MLVYNGIVTSKRKHQKQRHCFTRIEVPFTKPPITMMMHWHGRTQFTYANRIVGWHLSNCVGSSSRRSTTGHFMTLTGEITFLRPYPNAKRVCYDNTYSWMVKSLTSPKFEMIWGNLRYALYSTSKLILCIKNSDFLEWQTDYAKIHYVTTSFKAILAFSRLSDFTQEKFQANSISFRPIFWMPIAVIHWWAAYGRDRL